MKMKELGTTSARKVRDLGESAMKVRQLGEFIRSQRRSAQMSLRGLSSVAGVSLPYLSQIERGLRRPSAEIIQAIAKALRVSAQTLYVQAGILEEQPHPDVHAAILGDAHLSERQKQVLISVYESFRAETQRGRSPADGEGPGLAVKTARRVPRKTSTASTPSAKSRAKSKTSAARTARASARTKTSGRVETKAVPKPSPGSPPPSRSPSTTRRTTTTSKGGAT